MYMYIHDVYIKVVRAYCQATGKQLCPSNNLFHNLVDSSFPRLPSELLGRPCLLLRLSLGGLRDSTSMAHKDERCRETIHQIFGALLPNALIPTADPVLPAALGRKCKVAAALGQSTASLISQSAGI